MVVIKTGNNQHRKELEKYTPELEYLMKELAQQHKFCLPKEIIFRPMRKLGGNAIRCVWANAGWSHDLGYYISLDMESNMPLKRSQVLDTIAHEAAHIAEALKTKEWTHGKMWKDMYETAKGILRKSI